MKSAPGARRGIGVARAVVVVPVVAILVVLVPLVALVVPGGGGSPRAAAQTAGSISGVVRAGDGATVALEGITVQLVQLGRDARAVGSTQVVDGRFRFEIPEVSANATYVVGALVDGVTYLGATPLVLSAELPQATTDVVVWPAATSRPALRSELSGLTVVFVDTRSGEVALQREDLVLNPTPATWSGDGAGVTLRVPLTAGARGIEGEAWYDGLPVAVSFTGGPGEASAQVVLRPGVTLVTTRYRAPLDIAAAEVGLELTAALPTDHLRILVPERFARTLLPGARAVAVEPVTIEGERVFVVESAGAAEAGASIGGRVRGLGGRLEANPLSGAAGAAIGFGAVVLVIAVGAHLASRAASGAAARTASGAAVGEALDAGGVEAGERA